MNKLTYEFGDKTQKIKLKAIHPIVLNNKTISLNVIGSFSNHDLESLKSIKCSITDTDQHPTKEYRCKMNGEAEAPNEFIRFRVL